MENFKICTTKRVSLEGIFSWRIRRERRVACRRNERGILDFSLELRREKITWEILRSRYDNIKINIREKESH
jgi:hypothetical protein